MTIKVDARGDERAALSPGQREAPSIDGHMVAGLTIVGKRLVNNEGQGGG